MLGLCLKPSASRDAFAPLHFFFLQSLSPWKEKSKKDKDKKRRRSSRKHSRRSSSGSASSDRSRHKKRARSSSGASDESRTGGRPYAGKYFTGAGLKRSVKSFQQLPLLACMEALHIIDCKKRPQHH